MKSGLSNSVLDAIGGTPMLELDGVYCKLEYLNPSGSVKARIAKYMIERAEEEDEAGQAQPPRDQRGAERGSEQRAHDEDGGAVVQSAELMSRRCYSGVVYAWEMPPSTMNAVALT